MRKAQQKYLMISAVAERYDIHPQTLRMYEREGLITPARSKGNTRLYDRAALEQLEQILTLTRDMGINLAGVEVILELQDQLRRSQEELRQAVRRVESEQRDRRAGIERRHALVRVESGALVKR
jgi:MerR family transcriptional regulator/heat shock protein HspR